MWLYIKEMEQEDVAFFITTKAYQQTIALTAAPRPPRKRPLLAAILGLVIWVFEMCTWDSM